ncbi:hypothetical protein JVU11DRAFT_10811 [Chiua virens]|nr:hypothetical protein JVU11DRAFT_10811 [Chiua virens]
MLTRISVIRSAIVINNLRLRHLSNMVTSIEKQKFFLTHNKYAVVGASTDQSKDKDVTPVHPTNAELEGRKTVKSVDELPSPKETALSIVTPAKVCGCSDIDLPLSLHDVKITIKLLEQAKAEGIPAIWIQPGAADKDCIDFIMNNGMADCVLWQGECLWRDGDGVLSTMVHERASM